MADGELNWRGFTGPCYRAVTAGGEAMVLAGTVRAGRYNRPGERTLYMSSSPEGVAAAMARYATADRTLMRLQVFADRLIDMRDRELCAVHGIDPAGAQNDWIAALQSGIEPASWRVADQARVASACGLIDESRRAPGEWHLVLFRWNEAEGAQVRVD